MNGFRRFSLLAAGLMAMAAVALVPAGPAGAVQGSVPGSTAPAWQTNGMVRAIAAGNGIVYVAGDFTRVRPPGAASGTNETTRNYLAAFDASTGALITSFNPAPNAVVRSLDVSPDGSTVYVAGDFTTVAGVSRSRVAAFSTSTGALTSWAPVADYRVYAVSAGTSAVYLGGGFGRVNNVARVRVAKVNTTTGATVTAFSASADNVVYGLDLSTDESKLYLAGAFDSVDGDTSYDRAGVVDATDGTLEPFAAGSVIPAASSACSVQIKAVTVDDDSAFFGAEGTGSGCFDGTFAANQSDGSLKWVSRCLGATQGIAVLNGLLYTGSHTHDCSGDTSFDPNAFAESGWSVGLSRHLLSRSADTGALGSWYPNTNGGTGAGLGPRVLATDGAQIFVGGEFTTVNGVAQQGFTRFSPSASPVAVPARPATPVAVARGDGRVSVFVQSPLDLDDTDLVVRLYRDGGSTPIATAAVHSLFWRQPVAAFEDAGLADGSSHTYGVEVAQANGTGVSARATSAAVTVTTSAPAYQAAVEADSPSLYWRLGQAAGPVAPDTSASLDGGTFAGGVTHGQSGAVSGDTAVTFNGSTGYLSSEKPRSSPSTFSVEAWVRTSTGSGGRIIGFGNNRGGIDFNGNATVSGQFDKHLYMTDNGRLVFGVYWGTFYTLTSTASYNDDQWHHVVGTQGPGGMRLYVDGQLQGQNTTTNNQVYNGFWRVGGDSLGGWPNQPTSRYLNGRIDEVAVYPTALSAAAVAAHFTASGR
ncbi:LamG domain-containing protein [Kineosporia sp. J2-2]|uniref:LamG domain-containing protein n=1 Tax=Kineosporia corallincola TaxID=2835133 RepID=A0ABS5THG7_9ACTN|nr:LamG domain-containing protein [Kineosporia corallincola]MBT0770538.1 LamG domain-containing protein [Kineosporia corallincola]